MKYLAIIFLAFSTSLLLPGCQTDDMSSIVPLLPGPATAAEDWVDPIPTIAPIIIEEETLDGARRWVIAFYNIDYDLHYQYQRFFSTLDGSFYNVTQLQNSTDATAKADLDFLVGRVQNTKGFLLPQAEYDVHTQFKPSDMSAKSLSIIANTNPQQLADAFENSPFAATNVQPYDYKKDQYDFDYFEKGDMFLFKTDRTPARYGAVRIIHTDVSPTSNSRVVEVIVQTKSRRTVNLSR